MNNIVEELVGQLQMAEDQNNPKEQLRILFELNSLSQQDPDSPFRFLVLRMIANVYQEMGDFQKAHTFRTTCVQEMEQFPELCAPHDRIDIQLDIGRTAIEMRDWETATTHTQQAINLAERYESEGEQVTADLCMARLNLALIYFGTDRKEEAFRLGNRVLQSGQEMENDYILGITKVNLGLWVLDEYKVTQSLRYFREAKRHAELCNNPNLLMKVESAINQASEIAQAFAAEPNRGPTSLLDQIQTQIQQARDANNPQLLISALKQGGAYFEKEEDWEQAHKFYEETLEVLEGIRDRLGYEEFHLQFFRSHQQTYEQITRFQLRQSRSPEAFRTSEAMRSRLLLTLLGKGSKRTSDWSEQSRQELTNHLTAYGQAWFPKTPPQAPTSRDIKSGFDSGSWESNAPTVEPRPEPGELPILTTNESQELTETRQAFLKLYEQQRLNTVSWSPMRSLPPAGLSEFQQLLSDEEAVLDFLFLHDGFIVFAISNSTIHFQQLTCSPKQIKESVQHLNQKICQLQDLITNPRHPFSALWFGREPGTPVPQEIAAEQSLIDTTLEKLFALLIAPVFGLIQNKAHWIIIPQAALHQLPWCALRQGGRYLVEDRSVSFLPSATLAVVLQERKDAQTADLSRSAEPFRAAFIGDPDPDHEDLELSGAQEELQVGWRTLGADDNPLIGPEATKAQTLERISQSHWIHLACHNCFDPHAAMLSFLKLRGFCGTDFLYAFEIAELQRAPEVVILSACNSGRSSIETGDEQLGIVWAFLVAGTRCTISTLWAIHDLSAGQLFTAFYQTQQGQPLPKALANAQRTLLNSEFYSLPCFWAPYFVSGLWNEVLPEKD